MGQDTVDTGFGPATIAALHRAVATRRRQWLLASTLLLGLVIAAALAAGVEAEDRTYAMFANTVLSVMSVLTPLIGVLLSHDLRQAPGPVRLAPTLLAAVVLAAGIGVFGDLVAAGALALGPASSDPHPWQYAGTIALGGVLVQVLAQLTGTGWGMLLRSRLVAFLATIVPPLGLYLLLGSDALSPAQGWLTPYGALLNLLSGEMTATRWAGWAVVVLIWGAGLNAAGAAHLKRHQTDRYLSA
jgi:hypothetical protein